MISSKIQDALNDQICKEMYSSNLYLSMAAFYSELNLNGFAHWMHLQAEEEMAHALKIFDYLLARGGKPLIKEIPAPKYVWESPLAAFQDAYEHEIKVTQSIDELANLAMSEKDLATFTMLQWFINEQVEEEASTNEIVEKLKLANDSPGGLFIIDNELKGRSATA